MPAGSGEAPELIFTQRFWCDAYFLPFKSGPALTCSIAAAFVFLRS